MTLDLYGHLMPDLYGPGGGRLEALINGQMPNDREKQARREKAGGEQGDEDQADE